MRKRTNEEHYLLTRNGETVVRDKVGAWHGMAAWARMMERMAKEVGTDRLRCTPEDIDGTNFEGGFKLEGPFNTL